MSPNLVLLLPLLTALLLKFNKWVGVNTTATVAVTFMGLTFANACGILQQVTSGHSLALPLWTWWDLELLSCNCGGHFDTLTAVMLCVVSFVSFCVHVYSLEYMRHDPHLQRFLCYLSLFTFFMILLLTSGNFLQLFTGWEGIGLCSYLLVNFWYTRIQANKAAIKAVLVNRIGDTAFAIAIFLIFRATGALDFPTVFGLAQDLPAAEVNLICGFLFIGAVGKSAQLGLHTWLPDAMEGPTPVSSLIHSSTMVTAGVFLILRCSPLFQEAHLLLPIMTVVGTLTTFFAATTALVQTDLKRVIAYSTCSQLGYMVTACGLSAYQASIFHLSNHAFFKALLFLTAGSVIHALGNQQDMRRMGGVANLLPFSYTMVLLGSLALMGFPFLSGYYSKDVILEMAYGHFSLSGHFAFWLGSVAAACTAFYSVRLICLSFLGEVNLSRVTVAGAHDAPLLMAVPMGLLSVPSVFIGYLSRDFFVGLGTPFWGASLQLTGTSYGVQLAAEFLPFSVKIIPVAFSGLGTAAAIGYYCWGIGGFRVLGLGYGFRAGYGFLAKKWYLDKLYNELLVQHFLGLGYGFSYGSLDRGLLELWGPKGAAEGLGQASRLLLGAQLGLAYSHLRVMGMGLLLVMGVLGALSLGLPLELLLCAAGLLLLP